MARARNIKPGFFTNDILGELPTIARLLFAGLWCHADREGRLEDRPKRIKAEILPYDECDCNGLIQCLHDAGMVLRYVVDGKAYIQIVNFTKHQNPHVKEAESQIPAPDKNSANPEKHEASRADSLLLIPDSLNPSTTLSGKPDGAQPENGKSENPALIARRIIAFLNEKTGRNYHATRKHIGFVVARLKGGATETECRQIIVRKCREWLADEKMNKFLRPETLFNETKFGSYQGELVADVSRETIAPMAQQDRAAAEWLAQSQPGMQLIEGTGKV